MTLSLKFYLLRVKKRHSTGSSSSSTPSPAMAEIQGYKAKLAERSVISIISEHSDTSQICYLVGTCNSMRDVICARYVGCVCVLCVLVKLPLPSVLRDQLVMSLEHKVHHLEEQLSEATSMLVCYIVLFLLFLIPSKLLVFLFDHH